MDSLSPHLKLPYMAPSQAQKHVTHNEALRRLDAVVQLTISAVVDNPSSDPAEGQRVIIGDNATDIFAGHSAEIAAFQDGAWMFIMPEPGWRAYNVSDNTLLIFTDGIWTALSTGETVSINPADFIGVNATADSNNRLIVRSPATLFDHEGAGHQLKVNKSDAGNTASLLFQSAYSGRAEMGLTGSNDFRVKVSPDGSTFHDAIEIDAQTGHVNFPKGTLSGLDVPRITLAGGDEHFYGPPNLISTSYGRATVNLTSNRVYFLAFYVDRPSRLVGGFMAQRVASTTAGALIRCGLYHLGTASGNNWNIGDRIVDMGTQPADIAGIKTFDLSSSILLEPGWYANAVGVNGVGANVSYVRMMTPGLQRYFPHGSGTGADIRTGGATIYLYDGDTDQTIANGYPAQWTRNPVSDVTSTVTHTYMMFMPKWERWT